MKRIVITALLGATAAAGIVPRPDREALESRGRPGQDQGCERPADRDLWLRRSWYGAQRRAR